MDDSQFDSVTRAVPARLGSRRQMTGGLLAAVGSLAAALTVDEAHARKKRKKKKKVTCPAGEIRCPKGFPSSCCSAGSTCCDTSRLGCCAV